MNLRLLSSILVSLVSVRNVAGFTKVSRPLEGLTQARHDSDSSLFLLSPSFAVSTALMHKDRGLITIETTATTTPTTTTTIRKPASTSAYSSELRGPVVSYTEQRRNHHHHHHHHAVLYPAVEGVKQMVDDAKSAVSNLAQTASSLGVSFGLSYSLLSQINGGITLAVAWYMTCQRTGVSPVYQWKALLKSYGTLYAFLQAVKPVRIAAAISMARFSQQWLDATQERLQCGRGKAIALQYATGYVLQALIGTVGIGVASTVSGVPVFASH